MSTRRAEGDALQTGQEVLLEVRPFNTDLAREIVIINGSKLQSEILSAKHALNSSLEDAGMLQIRSANATFNFKPRDVYAFGIVNAGWRWTR
jgi:hypothetical protein